MDQLTKSISEASSLYNKGLPHLDTCIETALLAFRYLSRRSAYCQYGHLKTLPHTEYWTFADGEKTSRPVRPDLIITDENQLIDAFNTCLKSSLAFESNLAPLLNQVIYTSVISIACCFDLWKDGSRKTPGTFFEVFMAALAKHFLPYAVQSKHIPLNQQQTDFFEYEASNEEKQSSISTDLVLQNPSTKRSVVLALKITTRERIVQPFAHQRILDSTFPDGRYKSLIVCLSETQKEKKRGVVNHICTPGPIKLYQQHLARISGLAYCDIPNRYLAQDVVDAVPVLENGNLFARIHYLLNN